MISCISLRYNAFFLLNTALNFTQTTSKEMIFVDEKKKGIEANKVVDKEKDVDVEFAEELGKVKEFYDSRL